MSGEAEVQVGLRAVAAAYEPGSWSEIRKIEARINEELEKDGLPPIGASGYGFGQRDFSVYLAPEETVKAALVKATIRLAFKEAGMELVSLETYTF